MADHEPPSHSPAPVTTSHFDPTAFVLLVPASSADHAAGVSVPRDAQALDTTAPLLASLCREESGVDTPVVVPCPASMAALQIVASYLLHYCTAALADSPEVSWRLPRPVKDECEIDDCLTEFERSVLVLIRRAGVATACQVLHTAALLQASSLGLLAGLALRLDVAVDVALSALSNSDRDRDVDSNAVGVESDSAEPSEHGHAAPSAPLAEQQFSPRCGPDEAESTPGPDFADPEHIEIPPEFTSPEPCTDTVHPDDKHRLSNAAAPRCRETDTPDVVAVDDTEQAHYPPGEDDGQCASLRCTPGGAKSTPGPDFADPEHIEISSEFISPMSSRTPAHSAGAKICADIQHRMSALEAPPRFNAPEVVALQTGEYGKALSHSVRSLFLALTPGHDLEATIPPLSAASSSVSSVHNAVELIERCDRQRLLRVHWAMDCEGPDTVSAVESLWRHLSQTSRGRTPIVWAWAPSCVVKLDLADLPSMFPPNAHAIVTGGAIAIQVNSSVQSLAVLDLTHCSTMKDIPKGWFTGSTCPKLVFPSSLETVAERAFHECHTALLDFSQCTKLCHLPSMCFDGASCEELLPPPSLASLSKHTFRDFKAVSVLDLSSCTELQSIPSNCFESVSCAIRLPASLQGLEPFAFYGFQAPIIDLSHCVRLSELPRSCFSHVVAPAASVLLPATLLSIAENTFEHCDVASIDLSQCVKLKDIPASCFAGTSCSDLRLPPSLVSIDMHAFTECKILSIDFSQCHRLTQIAAFGFHNASCTSVLLPHSLERLGGNAFQRCNAKSIDLSHCWSLAKLPFHCFSGATFTQLLLPPLLQSMDPHAFDECRAASIDLSRCTELMRLPRSCFEGAACGTISLPPSLESLGASAFKSCKVASIDLSSCANLESIAGCCFSKASCTELLLPASLRSIGPHAFQGCDALSIDLSRCEGLQEIHESCFRANVSLPSHIQRDPPSCGACCAQ